MAYSIVGLFAIAVYIITNINIITNIGKKNRFPGEKVYLLFLLSAIIFHIADAFWGFLYDAHSSFGIFVDTTVYFVAMATSIFLWGFFVNHYLRENNKSNKVIIYVGIGVFVAQIVAIIVNLFTPILFYVSEDCVYEARPVRYVMLSIQVFMYLLISVFTFVVSNKLSGSAKRRHLIISLFGLFMITAIILQVFFPLLPMYSAGYFLGICALHTLVIEDEIKNQKSELEETKYQIRIDPLTGVLSKHAYIDVEEEIDKKINERTMEDFSIIVFDLNDLKEVNDNLGHEKGDQYIVKATELIGRIFKDIPLYRVGGDEFAIILTDESFQSGEEMFHEFEKQIDENVKNNNVMIISSGMSTYAPSQDTTILQVFTRADRAMYARKNHLKSIVSFDQLSKKNL